MLLAEGADVHAKDNKGRTPLAMAAKEASGSGLPAVPGVASLKPRAIE